MSDAKEKSSQPARTKKAKDPNAPNAVWFKPVMFGFMLLGFIWIITYYVTEAQYPLGAATRPIDLQNWNILIGFGIAMIGFAMTTRWK